MRARRLAREAFDYPPRSFALSYQGTSFRLHVIGGVSWAHHVYGRWAETGEVFELVMLECLTRLLRRSEEPVFIDVGAFMGHYACYAAALLNDRQETYAIDSNPDFYAGIVKSIQLNNFSKLKPFNAVLSDRTENAAIVNQAVLPSESSGTVRTITLDALCRREQIEPKIVKIDVHGGEGKVLTGMQEIMGRSVEYILLELHPNSTVRKHSGEIGSSEILSLLSRTGFHVFRVAGHRYYDGPGELGRALKEGFAYRRLDRQSADLLLFDRSLDVFLLCSRTPDIAGVLGASVIDPGLSAHAW